MEGHMTQEEAERAIWSFYYQLDNSQDRRTAPIQVSDDEKAEIEADQAEQYAGLWGSIQRQVDRFFGSRQREEYFDNALSDTVEQLKVDQSNRGKLDPKTGLPMSKADLAFGRGVTSGVDLCMNVIIPPEDLAAACTTWLPPCPMDENGELWGSDLTHWQALALKPREINCEHCGGRGKRRVQVGKRSQGLIFISTSPIMRTIPCERCEGKGTVANWTQENVDAVKANALLIKRKIHELSELGLFDKRPVSPDDAEMHDLVWEDDAGYTIGFRLTWEGYQRMQQYCAEDPELQQVMHVLTLAGREVRDSAPEWAKDEFKNAPAIKVKSGGFTAEAGGFTVT